MSAMWPRDAIVIAIFFIAVKWNTGHADRLIWQLRHSFGVRRRRFV
jgi:hypothetical protein